ncbi:MAG: hypothetical protein ACKO6N_07275 [Myxococcota bacterium]
MRQYRVGQDIMTSCGKCKIKTWHVVFAMDGEVVKRVQCKICASYHNYKPEPEPEAARQRASGSGVLRRREGQEQPVEVNAAPRTPPLVVLDGGSEAAESGTPAARKPARPARKEGGTSRRSAPEVDYEAQWNEALKGQDLTQMRPYRADQDYDDHTVLSHPLFGVGLITKVSPLPEKRMTVLFKDGIRQLACRLKM